MSFVSNLRRSTARALLGPLLEMGVAAYYSCFARRHARDQADTDQSQRESEIVGPVDVVYTWVDDLDAQWIAKKNECLQRGSHPGGITPASADSIRYHNRDELRYSLRSVAQYAPFVRNIYLVTDRQTPPWLNTDHPRIRVVFHQQIFKDAGVLPTFNSHAIESQLHHIENLSERYLYFNDDFFLGRSIRPSDFFATDGKPIAYLSAESVLNTVPAETDSGLIWGAKNNCRLLSQIAPIETLQKFLHIPYSQAKSILVEMEERFAVEFQATAGSRFRSITDIAVASSLQQHYAALTGRAELRGPNDARFPACYINVASPFLKPTLKRILLTRRYKAFCINEPLIPDVDTSRFDHIVTEFLQAYFPNKSEFEI